jgi:heat-inducible transcriptional repressor
MAVRKHQSLPPRSLEILHAIVQTYIETGEPVASRTVSRRWSRGHLSPASIRNIMADLSDEGYLEQPHTSAGRIPTGAAFQAYAQAIASRGVKPNEVERARSELSADDTVEGRVERSSHLLSELTRNVGIAAAIPAASQTLEQVELVPLADRRVLMIVATRDGMVRHRVVHVDEQMLPGELASIRNYLNRDFSGWTLEAIQAELRRRMAAERAAYDATFKKLILLYDKGLLDLGLEPEVHMGGTSNLVGIELHLTRERMRELFRALEEKERILQLLERFLEGPSEDVTVRVGLGEVHPSMAGLALIGLNLPLSGGLSAKIAVLGPMRMNYSRVISAVLGVGEAFRSLPV